VCDLVNSCSAVAGGTVGEWLREATRRTTRRQNAAAYMAWEAAHYCERGLDVLDEATAAASLDGAEW
jgi:hypothetical protein